ncbi:MAG: SGNH/GDSL hydrolase family protein [Clostridia bacterium]|nr:SGNH/GDSL hydrolase family protein [Clostridia bacterium]
MFKKYVSNTAAGTGTNFILLYDKPTRLRARIYFRPEVFGDFNWRFYYVNSVNSTFGDGDVAQRNRSGGSWRILSAAIADGGVIDGPEVVPGELELLPVTYDGSTSRNVQPDEAFWSDPVKLNIPDGHYIAFEWELEGDAIPCTPDSRTAAFIDMGGGWTTGDHFDCPMPALIGCDRPYKKRVAFVGDSITQGCGTRKNYYENWVHRIAAMLQPDYAVWNLGLGFARCDDAATDGCWLNKVKQSDVVVVTCGTNDLLRGPLGLGRPSTAGELCANLQKIVKALKEAGAEVILSIIPPFSYSEKSVLEWRAFNLAIPSIAAQYGCRVFDLDGAIEGDSNLDCRYPYGAHPDGEGGRVIAEKFYETFHIDSGWNL